MGPPLLLLNVGLFLGTAALFSGVLWYVLYRLPRHPPAGGEDDGGRAALLLPAPPGPVAPVDDDDLARSA